MAYVGSLDNILRSAENTPAQTSLSFALEGASMHKSRCGRHQINLFNVLKGDLDKQILIFHSARCKAVKQQQLSNQVT